MDWQNLGQPTCVGGAVHNDHYWQVYFDTNRLIRNTFGEAEFSAPGQFVFLE